MKQNDEVYLLHILDAINQTDDDFELFLESELGVFILETERLEEAAQIIMRLKGGI